MNDIPLSFTDKCWLIIIPSNTTDRSRWSCSRRRRSEIALSRIRMLLRVWMFVCFVCCVGSGFGWPLVQRSHVECVYVCVPLCVIYKPQHWGGLCPIWALAPQRERKKKLQCLVHNTLHVLAEKGYHQDHQFNLFFFLSIFTFVVRIFRPVI